MTRNVTNMNDMFYDCENLENINLSSFDTKNVDEMRCMFCDCKKLTYIDLSSFDFRNVENMINMFLCCNNLKKIVIKKDCYEKIFDKIAKISNIELI